MELKDILQSLQSVITVLAIIIGGIWAYIRFIRQREAFPKIIFELEINFIDKIKDQWIAELIAVIENKGLVRHEIDVKTFTFDIKYLIEDDEITNQLIPETDNHTYRVYFKNTIVLTKKENEPNNWLPNNWKYTYTEPGTKQKYSHIISIPKEAKILLFHSRFEYADKELEFHSSEKIIKIPD